MSAVSLSNFLNTHVKIVEYHETLNYDVFFIETHIAFIVDPLKIDSIKFDFYLVYFLAVQCIYSQSLTTCSLIFNIKCMKILINKAFHSYVKFKSYIFFP